ncbi:MAG: MBL fold metallo-hydrolase [Clostridia bacterium]|nr:MBL fold metallo-hydrolase [Clostridia bacterium]
MYCTRKVTDDLVWIGADDRRLAMFEGVYSVPDGVSYNSYLLKDDKVVVFDTVDKAVATVYFENLEHELGGRKIDYLIVQHMEPDHAGTMDEFLLRYPDVTIVCNEKSKEMMDNFFDLPDSTKFLIQEEGSTLETGHHTLVSIMAPMVHWPEVMMTYDTVDKILFSADAFGTFGALNGALFADEVNFERDYLDEARRYYANIVGKYGPQVQAVLIKASKVEIEMICPLHGFVWRSHMGDYIAKYAKWAGYIPEEEGVMIAYASVYGHTENTANILACRLRELGIKVQMFDVSVTPTSDIVAACFKWSHFVFASTTYNAGIFISMDEVLRDIAAHNMQNRTVAFIENGSWMPVAGQQMKEVFEPLKNITYMHDSITVKSALKEPGRGKVDELAAAIAASIHLFSPEDDPKQEVVNVGALFKLSYGLFVVSSQEKDGSSNGCITNTVMQITDTPNRVAISINKANHTHDLVKESGIFNVSVLDQRVPFKVFQQFGFQSGRDLNKFADFEAKDTTANGLMYLTDYSNAVICGKVIQEMDCGTHTIFLADVTEACILSDSPSVTYEYYFEHVKPKLLELGKPIKGWVCKVCGYVYEGEELPPDYICPLCKHGAEAFVYMGG